MNHEVSIIIPAYNSSEYIAKTIESVLSQTYPWWEMIIVDDCSEDNTYEIAKKYSRTDRRIKVIRLKKNSGAAFARNVAISKAKGRFIAFLDSDDLWLPEKLEIQISFMLKNNLSFTYSSYYLIDEIERDCGIFITKEKIDYNSMLKTCSVGCLTAIYDVQQLGKMYMPDIPKRQDYALWLAILKRIGETKGILEPLAKYRIRSGSVSRNKIKAAWYQWKVYSDIEKLSFVKSIYYFLHYTWNGFFKYKNFNSSKLNFPKQT